jgi:predicted transcriptional regulator
MGSDQADRGELAALTCVVAAYVANHALPASELPTIIRVVHAALRGVGQAPATEPAPARTPAVLVKRSVTPDHLVCLEDGVHLITLKRHLLTAHGLTPEEYRARWGLAWDYPMAAPNYSERRAAFARSIGLGRSRSESAPEPPKRLEPSPDSTAAAKAAPRRRRRGKSAA